MQHAGDCRWVDEPMQDSPPMQDAVCGSRSRDAARRSPSAAASSRASGGWVATRAADPQRRGQKSAGVL